MLCNHCYYFCKEWKIFKSCPSQCRIIQIWKKDLHIAANNQELLFTYVFEGLISEYGNQKYIYYCSCFCLPVEMNFNWVNFSIPIMYVLINFFLCNLTFLFLTSGKSRISCFIWNEDIKNQYYLSCTTVK